MRGPVLAGAGVLAGAFLALWLLTAAERFFSSVEPMTDRKGATILRQWEDVDLPARREPAWLRQCDVVDGPEPW